MPPQNPQSPKSGFGQSLGRLLKQGTRTLHQWHEEAEAEQRRAIANAKFPLFHVVQLLGLHLCLGLLPTVLDGAWVIVAWVAIIATSLYCTLLAVDPYENYFARPEDFVCSMVWDGISQPWAITSEKLNLVMKRSILGGFQHECLRNLLTGGVPTFCFLSLIGLGGLGLWAGHQLGTQFL